MDDHLALIGYSDETLTVRQMVLCYTYYSPSSCSTGHLDNEDDKVLYLSTDI